MTRMPENTDTRNGETAISSPRHVLALGVGGLTVHLAGWLFDRDGGFGGLFILFGVAAIVAGVAAFLLPASRPQVAAAEGVR